MTTVRLVLALGGVLAVTSYPAAATPQACGKFPGLAGKTLLAVDVATGKSATGTIGAKSSCVALPGRA